MIKTLVKLALAALFANAVFQLGSAYAGFYRFKDAIAGLTQYSSKRSDDDLRQRIVELASQAGLPVDENSFTLRREVNHVLVEGSYVRPVDLLPGRPVPWTFRFTTDTFVIDPPER